MSAENGQKNPLEYISLREASNDSGYTPEYLNSLARQGKLKAKKIGRNWHTTLSWLDNFIKSTAEAKKEKIEAIDFKSQDYTNGKVEIQKEEPAPEPIVAEAVEKKPFLDTALLEKTETKFQSRWKVVNNFATTLFVVFLLLGIFQVGRFIKINNFGSGESSKNSVDDYSMDSEIPKWISEDGGIVKAAETINANTAQQKGAMLASENFKIKEIKFGGAIAMASAQENPNFEISDVRSEVMKTKGKEEDRLLISWKTNRLALSTIEYSAMSGNNPKKLNEDSYGFNHSILLANLEPGTAYAYSIKGKDRWANEVSSDRYAAYTGSKIVSVFDLIVNAVKDVFGWAVKS
ncbi:MAG TPA: fibronectin type III domain-containing protein [Patescibacteria group bacterium]